MQSYSNFRLKKWNQSLQNKQKPDTDWEGDCKDLVEMSIKLQWRMKTNGLGQAVGEQPFIGFGMLFIQLLW